MVLVSSGKALDLIEDGTYSPGSDLNSKKGMDFGVSSAHPLYSAPRCGTPMSTPYTAKDLNELKLTLKVPQNANSFSFQFNFFSAEYPEFVCTRYNDRFIVVLESKGIDKTKLPNAGVGQCVVGTTTPTCNISYDSSGQPVTINNGFFDVCVPASGTGWSNACTKSPSMLASTGYDVADATYSAPNRIIGGATGWLTTKAPVVPGETI
ncbi:MAG: choice-of-anchor L domain-containing protein, partial [Myxococcaceae bacterium]